MQAYFGKPIMPGTLGKSTGGYKASLLLIQDRIEDKTEWNKHMAHWKTSWTINNYKCSECAVSAIIKYRLTFEYFFQNHENV